MTRTFAVAADLLLEASKRKWFLALAAAITAVLVVLVASLQLEVVDGALAATRLFGKLWRGNGIQAADVALRPVFEGASYGIFYGGIAFGIFACSDFAPSLLSPGRIEAMLALPVRRWELLAGTFLGVLVLALMAALYGAAGLTLVLGVKTGVWTVRPLLAALLAGLGFSTLYAGMLVTALFVRSAAMCASVGAALFGAGILASYRAQIIPLFEPGLGREVFKTASLFVPRIAALADVAARLAGSSKVEPRAVASLLLGFGVFSLSTLAFGVWRFEQKDF